MRIAYDNYFDSATIAVSPVADSSYPLVNSQDQRLSTKWTATSTALQTVTIDLLSAKAITTYALIGHNITSGATITFKGGSTTAVSAITSVLTYNENMMLLFASTQSYRYWQLDISGNDAPVSIGRIWLGDYIQIDPSSLLNFKVIKKRSDINQYSRNRVKYANVGTDWRKFELTFPPVEEAMISNICTMMDYSGNCNSLIFCNFDTIRNYQIVEPCYCSINGDLNFNHTERMKFNWNLSLEEDH